MARAEYQLGLALHPLTDQEKKMSAYMVFTREKTLDAAEVALYQREVGPTHDTFDFKMLVAFGREEVLEGEPIEGVAIVKFPTTGAAKAWYESPACRQAREHRLKGAETRCVLVQGV
jgi:uncharacterized protein (DUF1330 family)